MAQLTKHKRFQRSFELSEGDVRTWKFICSKATVCAETEFKTELKAKFQS